MASFDFDIDPRAKFGDTVDWIDGDDWEHFVRALNSGAAVRADGVPGEVGAPADISLDAVALSELKSKLSGYR